MLQTGLALQAERRQAAAPENVLQPVGDAPRVRLARPGHGCCVPPTDGPRARGGGGGQTSKKGAQPAVPRVTMPTSSYAQDYNLQPPAPDQPLRAGTTAVTRHIPGYAGYIPHASTNPVAVEQATAPDPQRQQRKQGVLLSTLDQYARGRMPYYSGFRPKARARLCRARRRSSDAKPSRPATTDPAHSAAPRSQAPENMDVFEASNALLQTTTGRAEHWCTVFEGKPAMNMSPVVKKPSPDGRPNGIMGMFTAGKDSVSDNGKTNAQQYYMHARPFEARARAAAAAAGARAAGPRWTPARRARARGRACAQGLPVMGRPSAHNYHGAKFSNQAVDR